MLAYMYFLIIIIIIIIIIIMMIIIIIIITITITITIIIIIIIITIIIIIIIIIIISISISIIVIIRFSCFVAAHNITHVTIAAPHACKCTYFMVFFTFEVRVFALRYGRARFSARLVSLTGNPSTASALAPSKAWDMPCSRLEALA